MKRLILILAMILASCGGSEGSYLRFEESDQGADHDHGDTSVELETDSEGNYEPQPHERPDGYYDDRPSTYHDFTGADLGDEIMVIRPRPAKDDAKPVSGDPHLQNDEPLNVEADDQYRGETGRHERRPDALRRATRSGERETSHHGRGDDG